MMCGAPRVSPLPPLERLSRGSLAPIRGGGWAFRAFGSCRVAAGVSDRRTEPAALLARLVPEGPWVEAEQVHGGSVAVIERAQTGIVPGCDALLTRLPGVALLVRTADCLPILFADPRRDVVGIAHAGWRGLLAGLPGRVVSAFRHAYGSRPDELRVAIGPAIRSCCYEVGADVAARFGRFAQGSGARWRCDLIGAAVAELRTCGIRPERLLDSGACTACEGGRWFSLRRDGPATGRLVSYIMLGRATGVTGDPSTRAPAVAGGPRSPRAERGTRREAGFRRRHVTRRS